MKILQINASYKPAYIYGGPTMSVAMLSEHLVKNNCTVEVFTTTANGNTELPVIKNKPQLVNGVPVRYFKRISKDHSHFAPLLFVTLWKSVRTFDVVHIHAWWNLVSILSCLIALLRGVPVVLSPRGTLSHYSFTHKHRYIKQVFHTLVGKFLLNRCHLHTTSRREEMAISQLIQPLSIFNSYNLVQLPDRIPPPIVQNEQLKLLFLSRIEPKKGIELLFSALAEIHIPWQLSIAGDGNRSYLNRLKAISQQYGIDDRIQWLGFKNQDKFELMAQHQVLVLPSYDENFGNVVIESLSVGTAVLISNRVGLTSYVKKSNLGWICKTSTSSVRDSINSIYRHQEIRHNIRKYAPDMIAHEFKANKIIQQYIAMYQQIEQYAKITSN